MFLTFRQVPLYSRWRPQSIYVALPLANPGNQHSRPCHSFHPLYFWLILLLSEPSHLWVTSLAHPQQPSSIMPAHQRGSLTLQFLSFLKEAMGVMENKTMEILNGDKVPLGDNKGATSGKLYLRYDLAHFNVSSFLDLCSHLKDYAHTSGKVH